MMMYNLIEATVRATIADIYESVNISHVKIDKLSEKYRHIWYEYYFKSDVGAEFSSDKQKKWQKKC